MSGLSTRVVLRKILESKKADRDNSLVILDRLNTEICTLEGVIEYPEEKKVQSLGLMRNRTERELPDER